MTGRARRSLRFSREGGQQKGKTKKSEQKEGSKSTQARSLDGLGWKYALMVRTGVWYCIGQGLRQSC